MPRYSYEPERESSPAPLVLGVLVLLVGVAAVFLVMTGKIDVLLDALGSGGATDTTSEEPVKEELSPRAADAYSWDELSRISDLVSSASSDEEGLKIANQYNLVDESGTPVTAAIDVALSDGTLAHAQLIGVRHDHLSDGGVAGLTYMLSIVADEPMCENGSAEGGWESSSLRGWLSSGGISLLPPELSSRIVPVAKLTNNVGTTSDTSAVSITYDSLWCLSTSEVCGLTSWFSTEYGPTMSDYDDLVSSEGTQYAYFSGHNVTGESDPEGVLALTYRSASWAWWYRTPYPYMFQSEGESTTFFQVTTSGFPSSVGVASDAAGVVVGFCI